MNLAPAMRRKATRWAILVFWIAAAAQAAVWVGIRQRLPRLRADATREMPQGTAGAPTSRTWDELPFSRGGTGAPLALRLVRLCRQAGIDSFSYRLEPPADPEEVTPKIAASLRSLDPAARGGVGAVTLLRHDAVLSTRCGYSALRGLLDELARAQPPLAIRRIEVATSGGALDAQIEVQGLSIDM